MRILELYLPAFGHFDQAGIDLSGGERGLHMIFAGNEAGKSTTLRAIRALFFGFPQRTNDDFRHKTKKLRIGAKVRGENGDEFSFLRRKGRKDTLLGLDGKALSSDPLASHLGGLSEELFNNLFGLDHPRLVKGGKQILEGGGELGEVLFSAALGGAGLRSLRKELDQVAEELFSPRGKNPPINARIAEFKELKKDVRERSLSLRDWEEHEQALSCARREAESLRAKLGEFRVRVERLQRLHRALPAKSLLIRIRGDLVPLADVKRLRPSFSEECRSAAQSLDQVQRHADQMRREIVSLDEQLKEFSDHDFELLNQGDVIQSLYRELGGYLDASSDRVGLLAREVRCEGEVKRIWRRLFADSPVGQVEALRISPEDELALRKLSREIEQCDSELSRRRVEQEEASLESRGKRSRRESLESVRDPRGLQRLLRDVQGQLADEESVARARAVELEEEARRELVHLPEWDGSLEDLESVVVPLAETVNQLEAEFDRVDSSRRELSSTLGARREEAAAIRFEIEAVDRAGELPDPARLDEIRDRRDARWAGMRGNWSGGSSFDAREADEFESDLRGADSAADSLRTEADRIARLTGLRLRAETLERQISLLADESKAIEEESDRWRIEWHKAWKGLDKPRSPREMRAWISIRERILTILGESRDRLSRAEELVGRMSRIREEILAELETLGGNDAMSDLRNLDFTSLVRAATRTEEDKVSLWNQRCALDRDLESEGQREFRERERISTVESKMQQSMSEWERSIVDAGLDAKTKPAALDRRLGLVQSLIKEHDERGAHRSRIDEIDASAERFDFRVRGFLERHAEDLLSRPFEEAVGELHARWTEAARAFERKEFHEEARAACKKKLAQAEKQVADNAATLDLLAREAGGQRADLEILMDRSQKASALDEQLHRCEGTLRLEAAGEDFEGFLAQLEPANGDEIVAEIEGLRREMAELEENLEECNQAIGRESTELERDSAGSSTAAESLEEAESTLAALRTDVERIARLRVASRILSREIERYRQEHQDPVLTRAGELFRRLTVDSFDGLTMGYDAKDRPVLQGRRGEEEVGVEGMSDGTRDQLFLALRLASLERHIDAHVPLPLIVDDVVVNFDDPRALATLEVLAELSKRTQVIFFTHHVHLVQLARETLPENVLQVPSYRALGDVCPALGGGSKSLSHGDLRELKKGQMMR